MGHNWKTIRQKLYGILGSRGRGMKSINMYDERGNETIEPLDATRFFVTFSSNDPDIDSFTMLVAIRDEGQSSHVDIKTPILENDEDFKMIVKLIEVIRNAVGTREGINVNWQDFDGAIDPREEAVNNIKESKDISKVFGTTKSSFQRIGEARLIIRHTDTVNEEKHGARTRHIKAIFVENRMGERFAYPHLHMTGARAFARHVSNGGTNHDDIANRIYSLSEDYMALKRSRTSLRLNEGKAEWIDAIKESMHVINRKLKSMHGSKGYGSTAQDLLGESITGIIDESRISELQAQLAECCHVDGENPMHGDLATAARYITGMPRMTSPMIFTWARRPDMTTATHDSAAERMYHQIMELADACADESASSGLRRIAEMISRGMNPTDKELDMVREAFASGMEYIPEDSNAIQEELELEEFLSGFSPEAIFSEDSQEDEVMDLEATGMDSDDAEQEVHDTEMKEWDTDPAEEDAQRAEIVEGNIELYLSEHGLTGPFSEEQAWQIATAIEQENLGSAEEVMDYFDARNMISAVNEDLARLTRLAGI